MSRTQSEHGTPSVATGALPRGGASVEVDHLTWRPFGRREPVLDDLTLRLEPGERVLLAGPSGSGKSTLLRALAGVLATTEAGDLTGTVTVDGAEPAHASVGLLLQDPADALVAGRVGRDVAFGPENLGMPRAGIGAAVAGALRAVGFPYRPDHPTDALSGGEAQRLALAGVLALGPRLVLLDEPTSMLDPASAATVRRAVLDVVRDCGATMVLVEHQVESWLGEVDRVVVLDAFGSVGADGPAHRTLVERADPLAAAGVWVPGLGAPAPLPVPAALCAPVPVGPGAPTPSTRSVALVSATDVSVVRTPGPGLGAGRAVRPPTLALAEVSACVRPGEIVAVVGPSGAGKTTLTGLLAGLEAPTTGQVRAGGAVAAGVAPAPADWSSTDLARRVGWVPQQAELAVVGRTVREDVLATSRLQGREEAAASARADGLLRALGLSHLAGADPHHLSGGEQRRLALAGALAHGPSVLVLDEPTVGQDRLTWSAVAGVVTAARDAGVGVVLATHDPHLRALADREVRLTPAPRPVSPAPSPSSRRGGLAGRSGPLSLLLASALLIAGAPFIHTLRTALVALAAELLLAPVVLGRVRTPLRQLAPGLLAVASVGFSNWLLSPDRDPASGVLAGLRVAFFVLPGVVLAARIDPFALGDHLAQRLRLPARPVVAAVAAMQRFESLGVAWEQLQRTRRVRGLAPGASPAARARQLGAVTFALLVQSLRQAGRMAVAMEARGFSAGASRRTWAEPAPWTRFDSAVAALGLVVAGIPVLASALG